MKISKQYLKQVIKEELKRVQESSWETLGSWNQDYVDYEKERESRYSSAPESPFQRAARERAEAQARAAAAAPKTCDTCRGSGTPDMRGVSQEEAAKALKSNKPLTICPKCGGSGITK